MKNGVYPRQAIRKGCIRIDSIDDINFTRPDVMQALNRFYTRLMQKGINNGTQAITNQSNSIANEVEISPLTTHAAPCFANCA